MLKGIVHKNNLCLGLLLQNIGNGKGTVLAYRNSYRLPELTEQLQRLITQCAGGIAHGSQPEALCTATVPTAERGHAVRGAQHAYKVLYHGGLTRTPNGKVANTDHRNIEMHRRFAARIIGVVTQPGNNIVQNGKWKQEYLEQAQTNIGLSEA